MWEENVKKIRSDTIEVKFLEKISKKFEKIERKFEGKIERNSNFLIFFVLFHTFLSDFW